MKPIIWKHRVPKQYKTKSSHCGNFISIFILFIIFAVTVEEKREEDAETESPKPNLTLLQANAGMILKGASFMNLSFF